MGGGDAKTSQGVFMHPPPGAVGEEVNLRGGCNPDPWLAPQGYYKEYCTIVCF